MNNVIDFVQQLNRTKCESKTDNQVDEKLDLQALTKYTGLKYSLLYKIIKVKRELPFWQYGTKIIVKKSDVDNYMNLHFVQKAES